MVSRVLHVIPSVAAVRGGTTAVVRQMTSDLASAGINTHIATTDDDGDSRRQVKHGEPIVEDGVTYWYFPRQTKFYTFSWPMHAWLARQVSTFQLVHIHALFSFSSIAAAHAAAAAGVPYIVMPHGMLQRWGMQNRRPWLKTASFRLLERRILDGAALIQYTSAQERDEAAALGATTRGAIIPNALATNSPGAERATWLWSYPELRGRRIILFLSRIDRKKGLDLLVRAFAKVRHRIPGVCLVIAGDGPADFIRQIKKLAERLDVAGDVLWTGFIGGDLKRAALAGADVFVLPSYSENFGMAVAEAMAAGVPVVVSESVAIHNDVSTAGAGLVVPCDVGKIAEALATVLGSASLAQEFGSRGRHFAERAFSSTAVTRQVMSVYQDVVSGRSEENHPAQSTQERSTDIVTS